MNKPSVLSSFLQYSLTDDRIIDFYPTPADSTHFIVSRILEDRLEKIGDVYVEFEGDEFKYISTNGKGKQLFPPTTDFNLVEINFERYARLLDLQKLRKNHNQSKILNHNINIKNKQTMNTQSKNTSEKNQKQNQLRFIEYEKPTGDGHFITVGDAYHNVLGRLHKSYNEETKNFEYVAFDHAGNIIAASNRLLDVKNEFIKNRETLLEQAHQRRIASKEKSKSVQEEKSQKIEQVNKTDERKNELEKLRNGNTGIVRQNEKSQEKSNNNTRGENNNVVDNSWNQEDEHEEELDDIRNGKDD